MRVESLTQLACQLCQAGIDSCNVNGNVRVGDRSRIKERCHQRCLVVFAAIIQPGPVLPAIPESAEDLDLLAELSRHRLRPWLAESPFYVRLNLRAEPEQEASI